jgi:CBS domain-containing protein
MAIDRPLKSPEQLLPFKSLSRVLGAKPAGAQAVTPDTSIRDALQLMAQKDIGFLLVLDAGKPVGVLSERDYARKVVLHGKASSETPVQDVMTREVVSVTLAHTIPQCMALMNQHGLRHLPVMDGATVVGVLSIRDLLKEIVEHHERLIRNLELEKSTMLDRRGSHY